MIERPSFVTEDHLEFLDDLRESGNTNMWGARPYLLGKFPELSTQETKEILMYWTKTFTARKVILESKAAQSKGEAGT